MRIASRLALALAVTSALLTGSVSSATAATTTGRTLLGRLAVADEAGSSSYERSRFGSGWVDTDRDGCDTREEVLIAESRTAVSTTTGCRVTAGTWLSWPDRATWTLPSDVDIDHVVALKEAWESGARTWTATDRKRYANDLGHPWTLDAITDNVNASKGDRDAAGWLPQYSRCAFARNVVVVKYRWGLSVDRAERAVLARILTGTCGARLVTIPRRART